VAHSSVGGGGGGGGGAGWTASNVANTCASLAMETTQAPGPLHAPPHPLNWKPLSGVAVSVTRALESKAAAQVEPQSIPAGSDLTVPEPFRLTTSKWRGARRSRPPFR